MATKLTFRARTLDATKAMAIYKAEDLPELADSNAINRSVPAMPSGMEKEEESEKHLQDILDAQSRNRDDPNYIPAPIPVPEVFVEDNLDDIYQNLYKNEYKPPRAYIHVQPFTTDADQPAYDMDEEDENFLKEVYRCELIVDPLINTSMCKLPETTCQLYYFSTIGITRRKEI